MTRLKIEVLVIIASLTLIKSYPLYLKPGEIDASHYRPFAFEFFKVKLQNPSVVNAKQGEVNEFCYLSVQFLTKRISCGCFLFDKNHVVSSGRCLMDATDKQALNITVTFPSASKQDAVRLVSRVYIPDGINGGGELGPYDENLELQPTNFSPNNIGLVRLSRPVNLIGKYPPVTPAVIGKDVDFQALKKRLGRRFRYRACNFGYIDNKGTKSKGVLCTEVKIVPLNKCVDNKNPSTVFSPPANTLCLLWPKREKSEKSEVCTIDFGGPVYAYEVDKFNHVIPHTQEVFCTMVGSPNMKKGTKCLDGHVVYCTFIPGPSNINAKNVLAWILSIIRKRPSGSTSTSTTATTTVSETTTTTTDVPTTTTTLSDTTTTTTDVPTTTTTLSDTTTTTTDVPTTTTTLSDTTTTTTDVPTTTTTLSDTTTTTTDIPTTTTLSDTTTTTTDVPTTTTTLSDTTSTIVRRLRNPPIECSSCSVLDTIKSLPNGKSAIAGIKRQKRNCFCSSGAIRNYTAQAGLKCCSNNKLVTYEEIWKILLDSKTF